MTTLLKLCVLLKLKSLRFAQVDVVLQFSFEGFYVT